VIFDGEALVLEAAFEPDFVAVFVPTIFFVVETDFPALLFATLFVADFLAVGFDEAVLVVDEPDFFVEAAPFFCVAFAVAPCFAGAALPEDDFFVAPFAVEALALAPARPLSRPVTFRAETVAPAIAPDAAAANISLATSFALTTTLPRMPFLFVLFLTAIQLSPFLD